MIRRLLAAGIAGAITAGCGAVTPTPLDDVDPGVLAAELCWTSEQDVERADGLLAGRLRLSPHPEVELPDDPTWAEDPLQDNNWRFQYHALRWLWPLMGASQQTDDPVYLDRALELAEDWLANNDRDDPPSTFSWNDHSTAWRAMVFSCLHLVTDEPPRWLTAGLDLHAEVLSDPEFYVDHGNHALNQDTGLLAIGCTIGDRDAVELAVERVGELVVDDVDEQGVMSEQAVEYQDYNYERYAAAVALLDACDVDEPGWVDRVEAMPAVLAHGTLPDGTYVTLGDTDRRNAKPFDHPEMQYVSSGGERGSPPVDDLAIFDAGFAFVRTGWGETRPLEEEAMLSARFGPPRRLHGHHDHGSVTLFADGRRMIVDPGKYAYGDTEERHHVMSPAAHNLVTVGTGCEGGPSEPSKVVWTSSTEDVHAFTIEIGPCEDERWTRSVGFLRQTGAAIVVDEVDAGAPADVVQRWQLELEAETELLESGVVARWPDGRSLSIEQLAEVGGIDVVTGGTDPLRGWVSPAYGVLDPAANVTFTVSESQVLFVTVLRPGLNEESSPAQVETVDDEIRVRFADREGVDRVVALPLWQGF